MRRHGVANGRTTSSRNAEGFEDIVWLHQSRNTMRLFVSSTDTVSSFWRISEERTRYPDLTRQNIRWVLSPDSLVLVHDGGGVRHQVFASCLGHHQYHWTRPRGTWFDAKSPVYFDLGEEVLCRLVEYDDRLGHCVRLVASPRSRRGATIGR